VAAYPAYDLAKAKQLVKELGGLSFTLTILNSEANLQVAQALQAQWQKAGIHATIQQLEFNSLVASFYKGSFQAALNRWAGDFDPDGNTFRFFYSKSPGHYVHLNDPQLDQLLLQGRQTADKATRERIYKKVDERLAQDMPYAYLWAADWWRVTKPTVGGIPDNPDGVLSLTDAYVG
jgi:peptide/nickel transport system substrate-binding protein